MRKGVNHARDRDVGRQNHACGVDPEGLVTTAAGGAAQKIVLAPSAVPFGRTQVRMRNTVEAFPASDGNVYIMRGGSHAELVVRNAEPWSLQLFELLSSQQYSSSELNCQLTERGFAIGARNLEQTIDQLNRLRVTEDVPTVEDRLTDEDLLRYSRQIPYFADHAPSGVDGVDVQERLARATVVVIGCGGLGSWALAGLACAGVGRLVLVDDDDVELSNLNRQLLYRRSDVGRPKVLAAAESLEAFNPRLQTIVHRARVDGEADVTALLTDIDMVIETADSPVYEISRWINRACAAAGAPHISAGQFPPTIRVGPLFVPGQTACFECQERAARASYPLYDELVAFRQRRSVSAATLGPASGVIGSMLAMEIVHYLTGICEPALCSRAAIFDLMTFEMKLEAIERDPDCPVCGDLAA